MSCVRIWVTSHPIFVRLLWLLLLPLPPTPVSWAILLDNVSPLKHQTTHARSQRLKWAVEAQLGMALWELNEPDLPAPNSHLIGLMSSGWCDQVINPVQVMRYWKMGLEKEKGIWQIDYRTGELRNLDLTIRHLLFIFFSIPWMLSHNKTHLDVLACSCFTGIHFVVSSLFWFKNAFLSLKHSKPEILLCMKHSRTSECLLSRKVKCPCRLFATLRHC